MTGKLFTMNLEMIFRKGQTPYCTAFGKRSFFHPSFPKKKKLKKNFKKNKREKRDEGEKKCLIFFFFSSTLQPFLFCSVLFHFLIYLFCFCKNWTNPFWTLHQLTSTTTIHSSTTTTSTKQYFFLLFKFPCYCQRLSPFSKKL